MDKLIKWMRSSENKKLRNRNELFVPIYNEKYELSTAVYVTMIEAFEYIYKYKDEFYFLYVYDVDENYKNEAAMGLEEYAKARTGKALVFGENTNINGDKYIKSKKVYTVKGNTLECVLDDYLTTRKEWRLQFIIGDYFISIDKMYEDFNEDLIKDFDYKIVKIDKN